MTDSDKKAYEELINKLASTPELKDLARKVLDQEKPEKKHKYVMYMNKVVPCSYEFEAADDETACKIAHEVIDNPPKTIKECPEDAMYIPHQVKDDFLETIVIW